MKQTINKFALLDSSVWVAFFSEKDHFHEEAIKLIDSLSTCSFYMPIIIYLEVMNVLYRTWQSRDKLQIATEYFNAAYFKFIPKNTDYRIIEETVDHVGKIKLKTMDLIILSAVIDLKPKYFYTYDQKLQNAYKKHIYEEKNSD